MEDRASGTRSQRRRRRRPRSWPGVLGRRLLQLLPVAVALQLQLAAQPQAAAAAATGAGFIPAASAWTRAVQTTLCQPTTSYHHPRGAQGRSRSLLRMVNEERLGLRNVDPEFAFFDQAQMYVRAGSGGQGAATFKLVNGRQKGMPDGGSGGRGGDVIFVCDGKINTLQAFRGRASFHAENGKDGQNQFKNGAGGRSVEVKVPPGTMLYVRGDGSEQNPRRLMGELKEDGERLVVAKGGEGGTGNASLRGPKGVGKASPPQKGFRGWLDLELKLVADVGLVGCPNAGKSTLLAAVSNAKPKIADYPFTTLVPNLGVCDGDSLGYEPVGGVSRSGKGIVISDVPGLLEGAHRGLGLGRAFLRHIERCRIIIHVVNGASPDPVGDFKAINQELALFNPVLASKPQVVVLNKIDLPDVRDKMEELKAGLTDNMGHTRLMEISAATRENTQELMRRVAKLLEKVDALALAEGQQQAPAPVTTDAQRKEREEGTIESLGKGRWRVLHPTITALALTLHDVYYDFEGRMNEALAALGLVERLREAGARVGDVLVVTPPPVAGGGVGVGEEEMIEVAFAPLAELVEGVE